MRKTSFLALAALGATLLLGTLTSCASPAGNETTPPTVSSTVYAFTQTPGTDIWPNLKIGFTPLTGKSISHLTYTFAVNSNMLLSAAGYGYDLLYNSMWTPNSGSLTIPTLPNTWTITEDVATLKWFAGDVAYAPVADQGVTITNWYSGTAACTFYLKKINVTYSDATTEVLTFTTTAATPVHIVATGGTTDVAFADRLWVSDWSSTADLSSGLTSAVETVSF
jgi:hypothetical protein